MNANTALLQFARQVLALLEQETEWSADTPDDIARIAYDLNLAGIDPKSGLFTVLPYDKEATH